MRSSAAARDRPTHSDFFLLHTFHSNPGGSSSFLPPPAFLAAPPFPLCGLLGNRPPFRFRCMYVTGSFDAVSDPSHSDVVGGSTVGLLTATRRGGLRTCVWRGESHEADQRSLPSGGRFYCVWVSLVVGLLRTAAKKSCRAAWSEGANVAALEWRSATDSEPETNRAAIVIGLAFGFMATTGRLVERMDIERAWEGKGRAQAVACL